MRLKYGAKEFAFEIKEWEVDKIGKSRCEEAYRVTGKECNLEHLSMFLVK